MLLKPRIIARLLVTVAILAITSSSRFQCLAEVERRTFTQPLDHFGGDKTSSIGPWFKQTYFVQNKHYRRGGPVLLYSVGERMAVESDIEDGWIDVLARETHGLIVLLELRFFGNSVPEAAGGGGSGDISSDIPSDILRFLTVMQMMADIRRFIRHVQLPDVYQYKNGRKRDVPWVLVGGSFAGSLMAWTKGQYPDTKMFVVASSAPMIVKDRYFEFDEMVARRLPCAHNLSQAVQQLDNELDNGDDKTFAAIKRRFGLEEISSIELFVATLAIQASLLAQAPARQNTLNQINDYCDNLAASSLAHVTRTFAEIHNIFPRARCPRGDSRSWFWQQCLELGMWQTAPLPANSTQFNSRLRSRRLTAEYFRSQCTECFPESQSNWTGEEKQAFRLFAQRTLESFAENGIADDMVFTVGELDPWRYLTLDAQLQTPNRSSRIIVIPGASHVEDLLGPVDGDSSVIQNTRLIVVRKVSRWSQDVWHSSKRNHAAAAASIGIEIEMRAKVPLCLLVLFAAFVLAVLHGTIHW